MEAISRIHEKERVCPFMIWYNVKLVQTKELYQEINIFICLSPRFVEIHFMFDQAYYLYSTGRKHEYYEAATR